MRFSMHARLHTLHCITPEDENGDEPYMFAYFVRADGTTLRQNPANPGQLLPSLTAVASPGAHGDLKVEVVESGSNFRVPESVGRFDTELQPIPFTFTFGGRQIQAFVPGRLVAITALLDEDGTSDKIVNAIHAAVSDHVQVRINEFFAAVNFLPIITNALLVPGTQVEVVMNVRAAVNAFLTDQLASLRAQLKPELTEIAKEVALLTMAKSPGDFIFNLFVNIVDRDDLIGTGQVLLSEDALIQGDLNVNRTAEIRENTSGLDGAWYVLHASAHADLVFDARDVVTESSVGDLIKGSARTFTPPRATLCVPPEPVEYSSDFIPQSYDVLTTYPFCQYRYFIDGQELRGNEGVVRFPALAAIQELDPTAFPFVKLTKTTKDVTIKFRVQPDALRPQLQHLILSNVPTDGTYSFTLKIETVLGGGRVVPVADLSQAFQGQRIHFPPGFIRRIRKCRKDFVDKWSESVTVGPKELWGPAAREQRYSEIQTLLDTYVSRLGAAPERVERLRALVGRAFGRKIRSTIG